MRILLWVFFITQTLTVYGQTYLTDIPSIYFSLNSYSLSKKAKKCLDTTAQILLRNPACSIEIFGYADSSGSLAYNQWLSRKRAQTVADYLISKKLQPYRIHIICMGEQYTTPLWMNRCCTIRVTRFSP